MKRLGEDLGKHRRAAAKRLAPQVERELSALGMEKARFAINFDHDPSDSVSPRPEGERLGLAHEKKKRSPPGGGETETSGSGAQKFTRATASGFDQVEFIVQTNPGLAPQPLRKIASGGELSRIMLALKGVLAAGDRVSVLVFDEIDANVGGRLGSVIGEKLRKLAAHHQVLCITHLPQIASYADLHLTVRKDVAGNETRTTVRRVDGPERLEELAEMLGGQRVTDTTRAQARELLESVREAHSSSLAAARRKPAKPQPA